MVEITVNYWAVLAAAVAGMALGALWYSPLLFGNHWMKLMGWSAKKGKDMQKKAGPSYLVGFLTQLVMAFVLAHFVELLFVWNARSAVTLGVWIWLGFFATSQLGGVLWEGKPLKLYLVNTSYSLVQLVLMTGILATWPY
jgi:hypothetical protein